MNAPSGRVLDLFAVPGPPVSLPGGAGHSHRAGDLVLSPGRAEATQAWLSPLLARLAVRLDESPTRRPRDLRVAMPVPARDGSWVVEGWAASRFEPEAETCRDLDVTLAAARLLHAQLDTVVRARPDGLDRRDDRWSRAESLAFGPRGTMLESSRGTPAHDAVRRIAAQLDDVRLGPDQLVHADLAGNVLLDRRGAPLVIDVSPAWRPVLWAEAVAVLDSVLWFAAPAARFDDWSAGTRRQALLRALLFRAFADDPFEPGAYASALDAIAST